MGKELKKLFQRKKKLEIIDRIMDYPEDALIIHYSCESFKDRDDGNTSRVTSIAVRNLESGQTESFSIHKLAEQQKIEFTKIHDQYDNLEKEMLGEFFDFLNNNQGKMWIHWNMRDINYGFSAIEHRFKVLQGKPFTLKENKKFDLSRAMNSLYGKEYIEHPKLAMLMKKNNFTDLNFIQGSDEADAFEDKQYIKLHQSTLRKVVVLSDIFEHMANGTLKTNSKWYKVYGIHPKIVIELIKEHWFFSLLGLTAMILAFFSHVNKLIN